MAFSDVLMRFYSDLMGYFGLSPEGQFFNGETIEVGDVKTSHNTE